MADKKQSAFTEDTAPTLDDFLTTIESTSGKNRKVLISNFLTLMSANITPSQWTEDQTATYSITSGYNLGNRLFSLDTDVDTSTYISKGMRFKIEPATTPPTQCTDLESGTSQYAKKTTPTALGLSTTASFEAWIKIESITGSSMTIVNTRSGSAAYAIMRIGTEGQLELYAVASSATSDSLVSYEKIPVGVWTHVAGQMTINSGGKLYINGVETSSTYTNGTTTAFGNTGDLAVGARADTGGEPFDGKISEVRVWSDIRTETEIRDNMFKQLAGNESNLVAYYKLNGDFNDYQTNQTANNMTGQNSAVATSTDNPFQSVVYAIVMDITSSTIVVFCPTDMGIPYGTLQNAYYSAQKSPYGFPCELDRWEVAFKTISGNVTQATPTADVWYNIGSFSLLLPTGSWKLSWKNGIYFNETSGTSGNVSGTLSTGSSSESDTDLTAIGTLQTPTGNIALVTTPEVTKPVTVDEPTRYYMNLKTSSSDSIRTNQSVACVIRAVCAYI
ncbi:MAG TPA: LamG domain-containing protein [Candidatus Saccharibacteria bacterium]|nr:LamG domain-containing protein [Candidatus Saccharibacteria bacterium]